MEFPEDINLEHMKVYAAPYGGPIAIESNLMKKVGTSSSKPNIFIFSSSGNLISKINVKYDSHYLNIIFIKQLYRFF